jgi:hypothetical protein
MLESFVHEQFGYYTERRFTESTPLLSEFTFLMFPFRVYKHQMFRCRRACPLYFFSGTAFVYTYNTRMSPLMPPITPHMAFDRSYDDP